MKFIKILDIPNTNNRLKNQSSKKGENMRYKCKVCGYIYNPEKGESRTNSEPGTKFDSLPSNWTCPKCGAGKRRFKPI